MVANRIYKYLKKKNKSHDIKIFCAHDQLLKKKKEEVNILFISDVVIKNMKRED